MYDDWGANPKSGLEHGVISTHITVALGRFISTPVGLPVSSYHRSIFINLNSIHESLSPTCFARMPQNKHPLFRGAVLRDTLSSLDWRIHLLPSQLRVLAYCVVAFSASISFNHVILGIGGPQPTSFNDPSVFHSGADLRPYGGRRAPVCRALHQHALRAALASPVSNIMLEVSENNAMSCFLMHFLENVDQANSQSWGMAYLSHVRTLAVAWKESSCNSSHANAWTHALMEEALEATLYRKPILISRNDQILLTGDELMTLPNIFAWAKTTLQSRKKQNQQDVARAVIRPVAFHLTGLTRQLYETITGDLARRHPLDETAVKTIISSLTLLHSIQSLFPNSDVQTMISARATLVLALHREIRRRNAQPTDAWVDKWTSMHLSLLYAQTQEMASSALEEVATGLKFLPSLGHITHVSRRGLIAWGQFALETADVVMPVTPEHATVEIISSALKLVGYSWPLPMGLIERLDAHIDAHRLSQLATGVC
ncbi:hypothetical protein C8R43DRAFT_944804 [Mycena crocata]|nr:hypothetical protein C8R43DRAFT_944804 [Mycena crocata]